MTEIRGILFDKDGTLVDFQKTWFAIGDRLALEAAGGARARADELMAAAGYDFSARRFKEIDPGANEIPAIAPLEQPARAVDVQGRFELDSARSADELDG